MSSSAISTSALMRVIASELEKLRDNPDKARRLMDTLYEMAKRKVVEEHDYDMASVLGLLFTLTKDMPEKHPSRQMVLHFMQKYDVPPPPENVVTGNA